MHRTAKSRDGLEPVWRGTMAGRRLMRAPSVGGHREGRLGHAVALSAFRIDQGHTRHSLRKINETTPYWRRKNSPQANAVNRPNRESHTTWFQPIHGMGMEQGEGVEGDHEQRYTP